MANMIAVVGESGSGKSTSLRNLDPKKTFIINIAGKPLPLRGYRKFYTPLKQDPKTKEFTGNLYNSSDVEKINQILTIINRTRPEITNVILEDAQYIMGFEMMERANEKGYDKFSQIANNFYSVLKSSMNMREDLNVCVLIHSENIGSDVTPKHKIKTLGKMLDNMITIEGLFTYVLFTQINKDIEGNTLYQFVTQSDGTNTAKTPMGCFDDLHIDNDLNLVVTKIDEYING